jgi:hypothetical protein
MLRRTCLALLLFSVSLSPVLAHDLWLMPEPDSSDPKTILIRAVVGAAFPKGDEARKASDYQSARFQQKGTSEPLPDFAKESKLMGRIPGGEAVFVSAIGPTRQIDLKPEEVKQYLREEVGLDEAAMATLLEGAGKKFHETYSRTLKSLVIPATASFVPLDVPFGFPLEIHLLRYERAKDGRRSFAFRLQKDTKPLAGASLRIVGSGGKTLKVRTDERGEAEASIVQSGPILIAFIELTGSGPGRYQTRWTNLAIYDLR